VLIEYTITDEDLRGPFVQRIPRDFEGMARLDRLGYRSVAQLLANALEDTDPSHVVSPWLSKPATTAVSMSARKDSWHSRARSTRKNAVSNAVRFDDIGAAR
jgi:hypothetical protein